MPAIQGPDDSNNASKPEKSSQHTTSSTEKRAFSRVVRAQTMGFLPDGALVKSTPKTRIKESCLTKGDSKLKRLLLRAEATLREKVMESEDLND